MKFLRAAIIRLTRSLYRIRAVGLENIPKTGPALLIANHLSLMDGFLIGSIVPRPVRFLIWRPYFEDWRVHWLLKGMGAIPISENDSPREIVRSLAVAKKALEAGDVVCLFAEGEISRTGNLLEFKRGFEMVVKDTQVPVIPAHLDRVWESIFSFRHGKAIFKWPKQIPFPVTLSFGRPVPAPITPATARQAVLNLGEAAFKLRLDGRSALPIEFLKRAKRQPWTLAVADSSGKQFSYGQLASVAHVLARQLSPRLSNEKNVGILLPASAGSSLCNIALFFLGRVPVNLNYTTGAPTLELCIQKANIARVITSQKLLAKVGLPETPGMIFIEDLVAKIAKVDVVKTRLLFSFLPFRFLAKRWVAQPEPALNDTATILFSSGSTGTPKGVMLSHANILSNILGLSQVFDVGPKDRMIGVLPFFHSFGYTATLWFPLVTGFSGLYHSNPLDAKTVGELAGKYKATLLLATPTFLAMYTRKCSKEQFAWMRFAIVGAEKLRDAVSKAFTEKFGIIPLEGYGCTELSPVATVNVPNVHKGAITQVGFKPGKIGQPIPGISVQIVHPDSFEPLPQGEKGMLLVKGLNVMKGYLGDPEKTKEVIRDGWYVTGDIAFVDADGFVEIVDRLSRFSKIAGEMVPHLLIEEKLQQLSGQSDPVFAVTSVADEKKGERLVVLVSETAGIQLDNLYEHLKGSDLPNLWQPAKENFFVIPSLPYLGTGKLDLAAVKRIAQEKTQAKPS